MILSRIYANIKFKMRVVGVIPARLKSERFPEKPLKKICGYPMIEWVYKRAKLCNEIDEVVVATDDLKIFNCVKSFGGNVVMTSSECPSGTDRVGEVAKKINCDVVINIQGDEPLVDPHSLRKLVLLFSENEDLKMATLITKIDKKKELNNKNVVKVVVDKENYALYFSRSKIPFLRNLEFRDFTFYKHIGIYGYNREFLLKFLSMKKGVLEEAESLEQLRAIENGTRIKCAIVEKWNGVSVDVPSDVEKVEKEIKKGRIFLPTLTV